MSIEIRVQDVWKSFPRDGERVEVQLDREALESCKGDMRHSIAAMQALLDDSEHNLARIERFPQVEDREACRGCPFRRPCGRL